MQREKSEEDLNFSPKFRPEQKKPKILIDEFDYKVFSPRKPSKTEVEQEKQNLHFDKPKMHSPLPKSPFRKPMTKNRDLPAKKKLFEQIPKFYNFDINENEMKEELLKITEYFMRISYKGVNLEQFKLITTNVCGLSKYLNGRLFSKLQNNEIVSFDTFTEFWKTNILGKDENTRLFNSIKSNDQKCIRPKDFEPILHDLLEFHPGLDFLKDPNFKSRYAETVIVRIFYTVNQNKSEKMTLGEFKKSELLKVFKELDGLIDINSELNFFSYEHFYVIYCKFWELDEDKDSLISAEDLQYYDNYSLNPLIVERVIEGYGRKPKSEVENKLNYEDFIWFILSEEDKTSKTSIEYFFRCLDLDGDGVLSHYELESFYQYQLLRMEEDEPVSFEFIIDQLYDIIKPKKKPLFTLNDLKTSRLVYLFFNTFCNYNKFMLYEQRDPLQMDSNEISFWNRFAKNEYEMMCQE
eukprot:gene2123-1989_t